MTKRKTFQSIALILCISLIVLGIVCVYRTPYGGTPEKAINVYLDTNTSSYRILDEKKDSSFSLSSTRYVATVDCKYNWRGSNQGRVDGVNIYFFDMKKSDKGWYVASANSGP
ncbi:hypothetical protein [Desulfosporosinus sp. I2]|uniref:hypothetical protein n=1 Tax=Desulfosporosinus sp. I2 TaxID=1617025 RepID=UPI0005F08039|nr:hypothetical protein [Desulfosporosinus sp. I2]